MRQFAAAAATQLHDFVCWQFRCTGALLWSSSNFVERTPELLCLSCTDNWRSSRSSSRSSSSLQSHVNCVFFFFFFLFAHFFSAFNIILLIAIICGSQDTQTHTHTHSCELLKKWRSVQCLCSHFWAQLLEPVPGLQTQKFIERGEKVRLLPLTSRRSSASSSN